MGLPSKEHRAGKIEMLWNEENTARLHELWIIQSLSASKIALQFGTTRSAIIGKVTRLGISHLGDHARGGYHEPPSARKVSEEIRSRKQIGLPEIEPDKKKKPHRKIYRVERTKSELRLMLAGAVRNTIAPEK